MRKSATVPNRIREIRNGAGLTMEELAHRVTPATTHQTIQKLETGKMELTARWMHRIAKALGVKPADLLGDSAVTAPTVPLVGYVGAEDLYYPDALAGAWGRIGDVEGPYAGAGTAAVLVRGSSMAPAYRDGDLLYFRRADDALPADLVGQDCVVQVREGPCYLKLLQRGRRPGRFSLASYQPGRSPLRDVWVEWAAAIEWVRRARRPR